MDPLEPNSEPEEIELEEQDLNQELENEMMEGLPGLEMFETHERPIVEENPHETQIMIKEIKSSLLRSKKNFYEEFLKTCSK